MMRNSRNRNALLITGIVIAILVVLFMITPTFDLQTLSQANYGSFASSFKRIFSESVLAGFPY